MKSVPTKKKKAASKKAGTKRASTAAKKRTPARASAAKKASPAAKNASPAAKNASLPPIPTAVKRRRSKKLNALVETGREHMGIADLRPGQAAALQSILDGHDTLAVMPTGSGKSLLYQLPSLQFPGLTVVVSPLIALIKDQVDKMNACDVPCARIDSTLTTRQRRAMDELILAEGGKLVLTTPERMADPDFRVFLNRGAGGVGVSMFVVDEAHCVSHWGHDFRPAYLALKRAIKDLGRPQLLMTTATAPPHVREDIAIQMEMPDPVVVTTTFDRPNLHYEVIALPGDDEKTKTLVTLLKKLPRPGLVYCATVRKVKQLYETLSRHGIPVGMYHGRMTKKARDAEQDAFMPRRSDLVMLATNAFGLGVDKPDIRYVFHYHVPGSLEQYAQEAGRGGRDGKPTRCILLFSPDDVAIQEFFLKGTYPNKRQVRSVVRALEAWDDQEARAQLLGASNADAAEPTLANVALASHVGKQRTRTVLNLLQSESWVDESEDHCFSLSDPPPEHSALMDKARQYEARRIADRQRLDALLGYVATPGCRNQVILEYLGERETDTCGRCDNDLRSAEAALAAAREAAGLERALTAGLDAEEGEVDDKPRRIIRHRVIDLDAVAAQEAEQMARAEADTSAAAADSPRAEPHREPDQTELDRLVAEQSKDDEYEYEYVDGDDEFVNQEGYEYGEVEEIDKTAAELAGEGDDPGDSEITILKRKQLEKPPKQTKPAKPAQAPKRKQRRRRRRKKKVALPGHAAFSSPVLDGGAAAIQRAARHNRPVPSPGGPLVEYVRGSMRINSTPVASATPNDQPGQPKRRRRRKPAGGAPGSSAPARPTGFPAAPSSHRATHGAGNTNGQPAPKKKKKKRRRRGRKSGAAARAGAATAAVDEPISFFSVAVGSPGGNRGGNGTPTDGPRKKKRRRRRRGGRGKGPTKPPS